MNKLSLTDKRTGKTIELPIHEAQDGPAVVEISSLYKELGLLTFDPGFYSTASCQSTITFIDGEKGILRYRGYPIEQLAEKSNFIEVAYLLLNGELPNAMQLQEFKQHITSHSMINEKLRAFYNGFHYTAHPMAIMVGVVGSLSAFYHDSLDIHDANHREIAAHRLISKMPTIAAASYKLSIGEPFVYPNNQYSYCGNLLRMMFSVPAEEFQLDPVAERALELLFIVHMDHEQNASTSTVRLAGSSGANPFACIASGITALWGPAHGGANEAVLNMLNAIGDVSQIDKTIARAKDKNDNYRLMGFGHRVYKNYDPRAKIVRAMCHEVLDKLGHKDEPLFELALKLEEIALKDDYFLERNLYPNVDFYSGLIYRALGIPVNMFTVMFAIARTVGWIAQWKEMMEADRQPIGRPRQLYVGAKQRDYSELKDR